AGGEVEVAVRLVCNVAVHLGDVAVELFWIHATGGGLCGVCVHAGSVADGPSLNLPERFDESATGSPRASGQAVLTRSRDSTLPSARHRRTPAGHLVAVATAPPSRSSG